MKKDSDKKLTKKQRKKLKLLEQ